MAKRFGCEERAIVKIYIKLDKPLPEPIEGSWYFKHHPIPKGGREHSAAINLTPTRYLTAVFEPETMTEALAYLSRMSVIRTFEYMGYKVTHLEVKEFV